MKLKKIRFDFEKKCQIKLPDAIIAATALNLDAVLLTNDSRLHKISEISCR